MDKQDLVKSDVIYFVAVGGAVIGGALGNLIRGGYDNLHFKNKLFNTPVIIEMKDMNNDGLADRVITMYGNTTQIQYQVIEDSTPHFYTYDQLQDLNKTKYSIDTTATDTAYAKH